MRGNAGKGPAASGEDGESDAAYAFNHLKDFVRDLIVKHGVRAVCEIGGGRNPLFSVAELEELRIDYTLLDISPNELALAPKGYTKISADICVLPDNVRGHQYDLVFSRMLAEHVTNGAAMHRNVLTLLSPGGLAFHFFPTLYSPAFVVNKLLPERAARWLLAALYRGKPHHEKFPARYSWCFGPTPTRVQKYMDLGYTVLEYRPFYGAAYLKSLPVARQLEESFHAAAARRRSHLFCSYAWLVLRKGAADERHGLRASR